MVLKTDLVGGLYFGPLAHDFRNVADALLDFRSDQVVYIPNPGNAGDGLIQLGSLELIRRVGIRPEIGDTFSSYPGRVVVYPGGGNLVRYYDNARKFIERNDAFISRFVLLPHTVEANEDLLAQLDRRYILFAREMRSFEHLKRHATGADVRLGHDLALYKSSDMELHRGVLRPLKLKFAKWKTKRFADLALLQARARRSKRLYAFRTDAESTGLPVPPQNMDLSSKFSLGTQTEHELRLTTWFLKAAIAPYDVVETDRLHVAILAAMMGKQVEMYDNSYGKNRAVYEHSLKMLDNVRFVD